jgi:RNA polymerase sigma-70 factor (ECF subfamily)
MPESQQTKHRRFEQLILPHLDAAHNLAHWLTGNEQDARDVVQDAFLRAWRFFHQYHGGSARAWLLTIIRNTGYTWLRNNRPSATVIDFDEAQHSRMNEEHDHNPTEAELIRRADCMELQQALAALPIVFREILVLRELEELAYKEISEILDIPMGTVMSRLARARQQLQDILTCGQMQQEQRP